MESLCHFERSFEYNVSKEVALKSILELLSEREFELWSRLSLEDNHWLVQWNLENEAEKIVSNTILTATFHQECVIHFHIEYLIKESKGQKKRVETKSAKDLEEILNRIVKDFEIKILSGINYTSQIKLEPSWVESVESKHLWKYQGKFKGVWNNGLNIIILASVPIISTIIFIASIYMEDFFFGFSNQTAINLGGCYNVFVHGGAWHRLLTGPFFHFDFGHYIYNQFLYIMLATYFYKKYGPFFNLFFILSLLVAPFAFDYWFFDNREIIFGGISSLIMAMIGLLITRMVFSYTASLSLFSFYALFIAALIFLTSLAGIGDGNILVSVSGHMFGYLLGLLFGVVIHLLPKYPLKLQSLTTLSGIGFLACLLLSFGFVMKAQNAPVFQAVNKMTVALQAQDSIINHNSSYNDSSIDARTWVNANGIEALNQHIANLENVSKLNLHKDLGQRVMLCLEFLKAEKEYYKTFERFFLGDSKISDDSIYQSQHIRDSIWMEYQEYWVQ